MTTAIVMSSGWGLRTSSRIWPSWNSTRRISSVSAGGGLPPIRPVMELPEATKAAAIATSRTIGTSARTLTPHGPPRDAPDRLGAHASSTSKKPIHPRSANSDWWAWNMKRPAWWKSISTIPRSPWHCMTVSVYSKWSVLPVR